MMEYLGISAVNDVLIGNADDADRHGLLAECFAHHSTQAAKLRVLLNGDDTTRFLSGLLDSFFVERLDP